MKKIWIKISVSIHIGKNEISNRKVTIKHDDREENQKEKLK